MATTLLVIKRDADRSAFIARMTDAGLTWEAVEGLPRHFIVRDVAPEAFPLADDPALEVVEDGEARIRGTAANTFTLTETLGGGSWAIARVIRRSAPWNVDRIEVPFSTYYRCARDGTGVDIYDLDTGIETGHSEFGGRAVNLPEVVSSGGAGDDNGHGSAVMACAGGGTVGLARGASLFGIKVLDAANSGVTSNLVTGLGRCLTNYNSRSNPAICNLSLFAVASPGLTSAIADLINAGVVVVGISGNTMADLGTTDQQPAEADVDVIVAGGLGMADLPYYTGDSGTGYGTRVDILAPAQSVHTAYLGGTYARWNGTSFAGPLVSGALACMLQGHSKLTGRTQVQAVKAHLLAQATTGKLRPQSHWGIGTLPDKILYLNPNTTAPESIAGL